jgi:hypothetical protein
MHLLEIRHDKVSAAVILKTVTLALVSCVQRRIYCENQEFGKKRPEKIKHLLSW